MSGDGGDRTAGAGRRRLPVAGAGRASLRALLEGAGVTPDGGELPGGAALRENRAEAEAVALDGLARAGAALDAVQLDRPAFRRRLTLALRALDEAARHPDPELRHALGACARRVLLEEPGEVPALELIELLGRLTALEHALLDVVLGAGILLHDRGPAARLVAGEAPPDYAVTEEERPRPLPAHVRRPEQVRDVLRAHFPALETDAVRRASRRLRRLGLFFAEHAYGQPTDLGREVRRLSGR